MPRMKCRRGRSRCADRCFAGRGTRPPRVHESGTGYLQASRGADLGALANTAKSLSSIRSRISEYSVNAVATQGRDRGGRSGEPGRATR